MCIMGSNIFVWTFLFLDVGLLHFFFPMWGCFDFFVSGWKVDLGLITFFWVCSNKLCLYVFHVRVICFCFLNLFIVCGCLIWDNSWSCTFCFVSGGMEKQNLVSILVSNWNCYLAVAFPETYWLILNIICVGLNLWHFHCLRFLRIWIMI